MADLAKRIDVIERALVEEGILHPAEDGYTIPRFRKRKPADARKYAEAMDAARTGDTSLLTKYAIEHEIPD